MKMKTITVKELRDLLDDQEPDALVVFTADYGDHGHTAQALPLKGEVEERRIEKSAYSNSGFSLAQDEDADHVFVARSAAHPDECRICHDTKADHDPDVKDAPTVLVIS